MSLRAALSGALAQASESARGLRWVSVMEWQLGSSMAEQLAVPTAGTMVVGSEEAWGTKSEVALEQVKAPV